ncbi:MAG TPA: cyclic nucleotide-binding domain-containing protein, partial [Candidatus Ozemobacteraceae bacterium]|nr:cyclic nucleotide-binding domain-containing protein [Candidatus Ozemobacteraceae bacterium]
MSVDVLKKLSLFEGLEDGDLTKINSVIKERTFPKGTVIFKEGDSGDAFYLILDGGVEVIKKDGGEEKVAHTIEHTDKTPFFGEMALIEGVPRSATLRASKDLKCMVIEKNDFDMMLRLNSFISLRIMTALSRRLRSSSAAEKPAETKQGQVIALFSPKSGSGKSILAANLAAGLTKITGGKTLLIDLDLQFGDLGFMLPLKPKHTIADLVEKTANKCQDIKDFVVDHALGFSVLPAPK